MNSNCRRWWLFAGLTLLVIVFAVIWERYRLVPYIPVVLNVYRGDHTLQYDEELLDSEHKKNIVEIFKQYGEYYQGKGDVIFIRNYLLRDMDLLQNYTNKAEGFRERPRAYGPQETPIDSL